jgi:hypothetical protein
MMKTKMIVGLFALSSGLLFTGCIDDATVVSSGSGRFIPTIDLDTEVVSSRSTSRADGESQAQPSADDLKLTLTATDGSYTKTWDSKAEFDEEEAFKIGEYELTATLGDPDAEGFDCAAYQGKTKFTIKENEATTVSLTAKLVQAMLTVNYTDGFKGYMADYSATVTTTGLVGKVDYAKDETRPAYLTPGAVTLVVNVTKPNGKTGSFTVGQFDLQARHHYTINVDFNGGDYGSAAMNVTFDEMLDEEDEIIDLSDDIFDMPAPVVTAEGFTSGTTMEIAEGAVPASDVTMSIIALGKIKSAVLTTTSTSLVAQGWPVTVDLANASDADKATLQGLGLTAVGLWKNPNQMAVVNFTNVLKNIKTVSGNNESHFTLVVTDQSGKTTAEPVELAVSLESVILQLYNPSQLNYGDTEMTVDVTYNGVNPQANVKIQMMNSRGTWDDLTVTKVESISRAEAYYRFYIQVPNTDSNLQLRAVTSDGGKASSTLEVVHTSCALNVSENNVFAHDATFSVVAKDAASAATNGTLYLSTDGTSFSEAAKTVSGSNIAVANLSAATKYYAKLLYDGDYSPQVTFTTEAAPQLENSDMESWTRVAGDTSYWWIDYPGESTSTIWGTMNLYTTSEGGSTTNALNSNRDGMAYCANSGTTYTTTKEEIYGGSKAAVIRTVGWGKGNAAGNSTFAKCNHVTPGELFLGTPNNTATQSYGIEFTSRPKALNFYYMYAAQNSKDYGSATIQVLDKDGNVVASKSMTISSQEKYILGTLDLTYAAGAAKAAKLSIIFRSSDNAECLTVNSTNLANYQTASTSNSKEYVGSKLYVDDIELIY